MDSLIVMSNRLLQIFNQGGSITLSLSACYFQTWLWRTRTGFQGWEFFKLLGLKKEATLPVSDGWPRFPLLPDFISTPWFYEKFFGTWSFEAKDQCLATWNVGMSPEPLDDVVGWNLNMSINGSIVFWTTFECVIAKVVPWSAIIPRTRHVVSVQ